MLGLDKAVDYYYYPGFHEPGTNSTLGINKMLWDGLAPSERTADRSRRWGEVSRSLAECNAENVKALKMLRADERIKIRRFNDESDQDVRQAQQGSSSLTPLPRTRRPARFTTAIWPSSLA